MIDVHCHLNFHAYHKDYDEVIKRAFDNGVKIIINTGTKLDSSAKAVELAEKYENLYAIVGVHPHHADKIEELRIQHTESKQPRGDATGGPPKMPATNRVSDAIFGGEERQDPDGNKWIKELEILARSSKKVVAIGEIGMDYYRYQSNNIVDPKLQMEVFEAQIELAHKTNLPLQIHNRRAGKDVIEILRHHKNILKRDYPGMFHCFAGDMNTLKSALQMGFMIGFDGNITYPGLAPGETVSLSELANATPLDRIVTETDSPFLTPIPYRGSRNEPQHVILVCEFLAKIKGISFKEMGSITTENAKKLFGSISFK